MSLGSVLRNRSTSYANGLGSLPGLAPRASRMDVVIDTPPTASSPASRTARLIKWRRVMARFRCFISTFLLSALCRERGWKSAGGEDAAPAANPPIHTTLPGELPGPRRQAGCHAHQREQTISRCGTEELASAFNRLGWKSHSKLVEL